MEKIKIAVVDNHNLFRKGLIMVLETIDEFSISFEAENGKILIQKLAQFPTDVILLDIDMPVMNGYEALDIIKVKFPEVKILAITMHTNDIIIAHIIEKGANGFLEKDVSVDILQEAIFTVVEKDYFFTKQTRLALEKFKGNLNFKDFAHSLPNLTQRELEVLHLICHDYSSKEIASKLNSSPRTIEFHRNNIIKKTHSKSTAGIVFYAVKNHLVD